MKYLTLLTFFSLPTFAADFHCRYFWNLQEIHQSDVSIKDGAKDVEIAEVEEYRFFITSLNQERYELQALNSIEPTRTYAVARVTKDSPELGLVIWKREHILEVNCSLK